MDESSRYSEPTSPVNVIAAASADTEASFKANWELFRSDLEAAIALKTFLVGQGVAVPERIIGGLAHIASKYIDNRWS